MLAALYLAVSSGVIVNTHYCMGRISEVVFGRDDSGNNCDKCGMKAADGCCHDEVKVVKLADSHSLVQQNVDISKAPALVPVYAAIAENESVNTESVLVYGIHGPPHIYSVPLNVLHCNFRI